eukprot:852030-Rhodomonas_salina.2
MTLLVLYGTWGIGCTGQPGSEPCVFVTFEANQLVEYSSLTALDLVVCPRLRQHWTSGLRIAHARKEMSGKHLSFAPARAQFKLQPDRETLHHVGVILVGPW